MKPYIRFRHKVDIYAVATAFSESGQRKHSWALETAGVKGDYFAETQGSVRTNPTVEDMQSVQITFPPGTDIDSSKRIYNVKDFKGRLIDAGPFEVFSAKKEISWQGFHRYTECVLKRVIEP